MRRITTLGIALLAMAALLAAATSSASASPVWAACLKAEPKNTGEYTEKLCATKAGTPGTGKYELVEGSVGKGKKLKVKNIGNQTLHSVVPGTGDIPITCTKLKGSAQPVAPNLQKEVTLEFKKCTTLGGAVPCENVKKETIQTNVLSGELAEVSGKVGTILRPETGQFFVSFTCGSVFPKVRVLGQVFGEYTGATNVISKIAIGHYRVGEFLGEPSPGYKPITNQPSAGPPTYGVLHTEVKNAETEEKYKSAENPEGWGPPGGLPSGQEGEGEVKGEALMIKT